MAVWYHLSRERPIRNSSHDIPDDRISDIRATSGWAAMNRVRLYGTLILFAVRARFRLSRPSGWLLFGGAILDPFVYAGVVYFLINGVFGLSGADRYYFLLIGFISLRWSIGCVLDSGNLGELSARMGEASQPPEATGLLMVLSPPTAVMAASLAAALAMSLIARPLQQDFQAVIWLIPVVIVQLIGNALLVLGVDRINRIYRTASQYPIVIGLGIAWFISPLMYRFEDLPPTASAFFTSFNPVSHVLVGYYNATWYGQAMSLEVLPAVGVMGAVAIALLLRRQAPTLRPNLPAAAVPAGQQPLLLLLGADTDIPAWLPDIAQWRGATIYGDWRAQLRRYTGSDLVELIARARGYHGAEARGQVTRIQADSKLGRLFADSLSIYPEWALAQIAFSVAVNNSYGFMVCDGLLDPTDLLFRQSAWQRLESEAAAGRPALVISRRLLQLPEMVTGRFVAIHDDRTVHRGELGTELAAYYDQRLKSSPSEPNGSVG